jgi:hypothetical protein
MPRTIRFHLGENCSHAIAAGLRRRGIDVTTTSDVALLGAIDEDQLAYCLAEGDIRPASHYASELASGRVVALPEAG